MESILADDEFKNQNNQSLKTKSRKIRRSIQKTIVMNNIWTILLGSDHRQRTAQMEVEDCDLRKSMIHHQLSTSQIKFLIRNVTKILLSEETLLELNPPIIICGDTHGQFSDVLEILDSMKWPSEQKYLFLGDYVDRGEQSLELICLIFYLKIKYPRNFFILRGNHEAAEINATHGFKDDCLLHYDLAVWNLFQEGFKALPLAALIGSKIFCLHGGLSPYLTTLDDIRRLPRPLEVPESGLVCDLIWSDPVPDEHHETNCGFVLNQYRNTSVWFCPHVVDQFLLANNLELIVRGHEMYDFGFGFTVDRKVLTVFTAPHYCGYGNDAAVLYVDEEFNCQIRTFQFKRQQLELLSALSNADVNCQIMDDVTLRETAATKSLKLHDIL